MDLEFKSLFGLWREFTARKRFGQIYLSTLAGAGSLFQAPMCPAKAAERSAAGCPGAGRGLRQGWIAGGAVGGWSPSAGQGSSRQERDAVGYEGSGRLLCLRLAS